MSSPDSVWRNIIVAIRSVSDDIPSEQWWEVWHFVLDGAEMLAADATETYAQLLQQLVTDFVRRHDVSAEVAG